MKQLICCIFFCLLLMGCATTQYNTPNSYNPYYFPSSYTLSYFLEHSISLNEYKLSNNFDILYKAYLKYGEKSDIGIFLLETNWVLVDMQDKIIYSRFKSSEDFIQNNHFIRIDIGSRYTYFVNGNLIESGINLPYIIKE